jgi:hypothetical protein
VSRAPTNATSAPFVGRILTNTKGQAQPVSTAQKRTPSPRREASTTTKQEVRRIYDRDGREPRRETDSLRARQHYSVTSTAVVELEGHLEELPRMLDG